jgi:hypothetical protein
VNILVTFVLVVAEEFDVVEMRIAVAAEEEYSYSQGNYRTADYYT